MTEALDPWPFVWAAYAAGAGGTLAFLVWNWRAMRRAEARRDKVRGQ